MKLTVALYFLVKICKYVILCVWLSGENRSWSIGRCVCVFVHTLVHALLQDVHPNSQPCQLPSECSNNFFFQLCLVNKNSSFFLCCLFPNLSLCFFVLFIFVVVLSFHLFCAILCNIIYFLPPSVFLICPSYLICC